MKIKTNKSAFKNTILCVLLGTAFVFSNALANTNTEHNILSGSIYEKVGQEQDVDPYLLYSISLVESALAKKKNDGAVVAPHKYAIRTPKGAIYPKTFFEAVRVLDEQLKKYSPKSIDVGLMQINGQHFSRVEKPEDLLKPAVNVKVACDILKGAMDSYPKNKTIGIGRYHSFTEWRAKQYGARVLAIYNNLTKGQQL